MGIQTFLLVVTVTLRSGARIRFRADEWSIAWVGASLTQYEFSGGDRRAPRYLRIEEVAAVQWRRAFLGLF